MKNVVSRSQYPACIRPTIIILLLCNIAISCSDSTGPDSGTSEGQFTRDSIGADGGTLEVTASDGATCQLTIPAGSLADTTPIKITAETSSSVSDLGPISNDFILEPDGLEFIEPVTITIIIPNEIPADRVPAILLTGDEGPGILLETQVEGQTLSASLEHFSSATAVAWTEEALVDYWDLITYYIERDGLDPISVENLFRVYYSVYDNPDVFPTIDLSLWYDELRELTNDLILKGSLLCSSGNCNDGNECLTLASKICMILYDDLADWALQEYDNCCAAGTILINQAPDDLSGAGWSLTGPRNQNGSGYKVLNDMPCGEYTLTWVDVDGYYTPESSTQTLNADDPIAFSGVYTSEEVLPKVAMQVYDYNCVTNIYLKELRVLQVVGSSGKGWHTIHPNVLQRGENTIKIVMKVKNGDTFWYTSLRSTVEVKVDDEIVISETIIINAPEGEHFYDDGTEFERILSLTL